MKPYFSFLLGLFALALAAGGYAYFYQMIQSSVETMGEVRGSVDLLLKRDTLARTSAVFISETRVEREKMQQFVVHDDDIVSVIEMIETLPDRAVTAAIASVEEVDVTDWDKHKLILMRISARGPYGDLGEYADRLAALPYGARLLSASFESTGNEWFGIYSLALIKEKKP